MFLYSKLIALGIAVFVAFGVFKSIENRGATKAVAKVERNNAVLQKKASGAARKSADPSIAGLRLPYYRDD